VAEKLLVAEFVVVQSFNVANEMDTELSLGVISFRGCGPFYFSVVAS
jgi:hypothetical protein